jgi:hypothetical protein
MPAWLGLNLKSGPGLMESLGSKAKANSILVKGTGQKHPPPGCCRSPPVPPGGGEPDASMRGASRSDSASTVSRDSAGDDRTRGPPQLRRAWHRAVPAQRPPRVLEPSRTAGAGGGPGSRGRGGAEPALLFHSIGPMASTAIIYAVLFHFI